MNNIVIYHKNCLDGTCAAWVASQYLPKDTEFIPVEYSKPLADQMIFPPTIDQGQDITLYILDWCPSMEDLDACCDIFGKVVLIDHHESAIKKLHDWKIAKGYQTGIPDNLELFLALNNEWSGAMGTAIWFGANIEANRETGQRQYIDHWLVKAVDDRDRWQFLLHDTKAINAALFLLGFNLEDWQKQGFTDPIGWALRGVSLLEQQEKNVQSIIQSSAILDDNKEKVIFCNCPYFLASEVGNILAKDYRMAVLWFMDKEGQISVSLRSNKETPDWINCSKIAMELKGGGHANAAGFKWDKTFEEMAAEIDDMLINTEQSISEFPF